MTALLRLLIPSWRFFDDVGPQLQLFYQSDAISAWIPFPAKKEIRHWHQLFINSEGNLRLALFSLIERLVSEIGELNEKSESHVPNLVSYQLVVSALRCQIVENSPRAKSFRFKILIDGESFLVSERHLVH